MSENLFCNLCGVDRGPDPMDGTGAYAYCSDACLQLYRMAEGDGPLELLNTSIATTYGSYDYAPINLHMARQIVNRQFESAIGHQATAEIMSDLLGVPIAVNRITFAQKPNQAALVFKLKGRVPEGVILSREEIEAIGYEFGIFKRTK